jgi:2-amino-4-hydroxy-6-hydroxymethyldihydropteridine diphosphokinase
VTAAWIATGANLGDPRGQIAAALAGLAADERVSNLVASELIETEPVGGPAGQPNYLNGAARLDFAGEARELLALLMEFERRAGRARTVLHGPRTLDLDLLLFGRERHATHDLSVPHPRLEQRWFVVAPLASLDPELRLPSGRRAGELAQMLAPGRAQATPQGPTAAL